MRKKVMKKSFICKGINEEMIQLLLNKCFFGYI